MNKAFVLVLFSLAPALAVAADGWTYVVHPPAGKAIVFSPGGTELIVDCGNSGEVGLEIAPDIRPSAAQADTQASFIFLVDGHSKFDVPMSCNNGRCSTGGRPGLLPVVESLRAGSWLEIWNTHRGLDAFTLSGSGVAINTIRRAGCPGF